MKKLVVVFTFCMLLIASTCFAVIGVCTQSALADKNGNHTTVTLTCTSGTAGDAGTFPDTSISTVLTGYIQGWYLDLVEVVPSAVTAPTNAFDLTFVNSLGRDILGGMGADLSNTVKSAITPKRDTVTSLYGGVWADTTMTQKVTGNSVASSIVIFRYHFTK